MDRTGWRLPAGFNGGGRKNTWEAQDSNGAGQRPRQNGRAFCHRRWMALSFEDRFESPVSTQECGASLLNRSGGKALLEGNFAGNVVH